MGLVQHEGGPCGVLATIQVIPRFLILLFLLVSLVKFYIMGVLSMGTGGVFSLGMYSPNGLLTMVSC